ncbi:hypothetical protein L3X38_036298 [Prunus dulcis]|uniref:DUF4218 domain-containing protein n=1 Tax=Prunus dulcis TaxID=3755 RepID=A0AAD4V328_PRUDU|nr:hypothetical protein L3X38_036298 [Prunus dulcis]
MGTQSVVSGPREWPGDEISKPLYRLDFALFGKTKNEFDTLVGTILDIEGKTKDTIKARLDLERMGIRRGLWMNRDSDKARRDLAFFSMKPNDKKEFLKFVSSVKFPDGYASNIARCMNLRHDIVQVLCKFEIIFLPAFFTSMMHVMVHLPEEALLVGLINYLWMYPIERLLGELKKSVRNRAKPDGSIIEAWVQYESLTFCGITLRDEEVSLVAQSLQRTVLRDELSFVVAQSQLALSPSSSLDT